MDTNETPSPTCIVAYLGEGPHFRRVHEVAIGAARDASARLILYDADAASRLAPPLPTVWSGDVADGNPDQMTPERLAAAGREDFAAAVTAAREAGVDAYGWLPTARGATALAAYAAKVGANLLILPSALEDIGLLDRLKGENTPAEIEEQSQIRVITVDITPTLAM